MVTTWLEVLEAEIAARLEARKRFLRAHTLGPQFFYDLKARRHHKAAKRTRIQKKWRNALLEQYTEWY